VGRPIKEKLGLGHLRLEGKTMALGDIAEDSRSYITETWKAGGRIQTTGF
jgi:hypothetical protein